MFAKLVIGASNVAAIGVMKDIGRLLVSDAPSTSNLAVFNSSSSIVYDATPAGWTYVGSNHSADRPTISAGTATYDGTLWNFCFSAPCLSGSALKYLILNNWNYNSNSNQGWNITGASSASSLGVVTNEGPRPYQGSLGLNYATNLSSGFASAAGTVFYIIATPRHVTIIQNTFGMAAIWETSITNAHNYYGIAPFISIAQYNVTNVSTVLASTAPAQSAIGSMAASAYNVTDPNTGTNYGVYDVATNNLTGFHLVQATTSTTLRSNTIDSAGNLKYVVQPIFFSMDKIGYPTQYVTGVVPVYYTKPTIGNNGDTISVSGDNYTFFDVSTKFGLIMKTA